MSREEKTTRERVAPVAAEAKDDASTSSRAVSTAEGLDRRTLLEAGALAAAAASVPSLAEAGSRQAAPADGTVPFRQPRQYTATGRELFVPLHVQLAGIVVPDPAGDHYLYTRTYNRAMPGPTFRLQAGDRFRPHLINSLPPNTYNCPPEGGNMNTYHCLNTTNLHTHGLHVSPESPADNVFLSITPQGDPHRGDGSDYFYSFQIPDHHPGGTHWYHAHHHGSTDFQVKNGMAGALIIEDSPEEGLPEIRAAEEIVMVIQEPDPALAPVPTEGESAHSRALRADFERRYREMSFLGGPSQRVLDFSRNEDAHVEVMKAQAHGDETTLVGLLSINGAIDSTMRVAPGEVQRWRMINSAVSGSRGYCKLNLRQIVAGGSESSGRLFQIAMDGLTLTQVTELTSPLVMAPGNRADFLVQGGAAGDVYELWTEPVGRADGGGPDAPAQRLLTVEVVGTPVNMAMPADGTPLPQPAFLTPIQESEVTVRKELVFNVDNGFRIDGRLFQANRVDQCFRVGDVVELTIRNIHRNGHPFHIHVNPFYAVESYNPAGESPPLPRWMDTFSIPGASEDDPPDAGWIKVRTRISELTGSTVLHCHILSHEDQGMMQRVEIKPEEETCPPTPYFTSDPHESSE